MPLPSAAQLTRMRAQANGHGQTAAILTTKTETNSALGQVVTYHAGSTIYGLRYSITKSQALASGALVIVTEEHFTCPTSTAVTTDDLLVINDEYYEVIDISTFDENMQILKDLTIKRTSV